MFQGIFHHCEMNCCCDKEMYSMQAQREVKDLQVWMRREWGGRSIAKACVHTSVYSTCGRGGEFRRGWEHLARMLGMGHG